MARPEFEIDDPVYLISDPDQVRLQIVTVIRTPIGYKYGIGMEDGEIKEVYGIQISKTRDVIGDIIKSDE